MCARSSSAIGWMTRTLTVGLGSGCEIEGFHHARVRDLGTGELIHRDALEIPLDHEHGHVTPPPSHLGSGEVYQVRGLGLGRLAASRGASAGPPARALGNFGVEGLSKRA